MALKFGTRGGGRGEAGGCVTAAQLHHREVMSEIAQCPAIVARLREFKRPRVELDRLIVAPLREGERGDAPGALDPRVLRRRRRRRTRGATGEDPRRDDHRKHAPVHGRMA